MSTFKGSLQRMFESEYFSLPMALVHLQRNEHTGVQAYLVNKLFSYPAEDVAFYLPQLVNLTLKREDSEELGTYLLDMASKSYLFAMNLYWHLHSKLDSKRYRSKLDELLHDCEMTLVNGVRPQRAKTSEPPPLMFAIPGIDEAMSEDYAYTYKQHRNDYFLLQSKLLFALTGISIALIDQEADQRDEYLKKSLQMVDQIIEETREKHSGAGEYIRRLFRGAILPSTFCEDPDISEMQVVKIPFEFAACYKTKSRVPYKVYLEMVSLNEDFDTSLQCDGGEAENVTKQQEINPVLEADSEEMTKVHSEEGKAEEIDSDPREQRAETDSAVEIQAKSDQRVGRPSLLDVDPVLETDPAFIGRRVEQIENLRFEGLPEYAEKVQKAEQDGLEVSVLESSESVVLQSDQQGDQWQTVAANIRALSPYGGLRSWKLRAFIVKGQDDLRQELLAMQFIKKVNEILRSVGVSAYLRPYEIYVVADNAGLIEFIPDSQSLSSIHKRYRTLLEYYKHTWEGTFPEAQKNFTESMAGYSLICYLLNIKDRHNGNILVDSFGHIIHIDFGFFLTSSPGGNINFETAPFKMTKEMLDLMGGDGGEMVQYFKILLFRGFLELRKHKEELILLVQMMMSAEPLNCFVKEEKVIKELDERFHLTKTDEQCYQLVEDLMSQASQNWRTVKYDSFQRYSNGIL